MPTPDITDEQIEALMDEARRHCDDFMIQICTRALGGSVGHRQCCALTWREEHGTEADGDGAQKAVAMCLPLADGRPGLAS